MAGGGVEDETVGLKSSAVGETKRVAAMSDEREQSSVLIEAEREGDG